MADDVPLPVSGAPTPLLLSTGAGGAAGSLGRGVRCSKGILHGETVFEERPVLSVADPSRPADAVSCAHCQRSLLRCGDCASLPRFLRQRDELWPLGGPAIPCEHDCGDTWCSEHCRAAARDTYHAVECGAAAALREFASGASRCRPGGADYAAPLRLALRMIAALAQATAARSWPEACAATRHPAGGEGDDAPSGEDIPYGAYSSSLPPAFAESFPAYSGLFAAALGAIAAQVPDAVAPAVPLRSLLDPATVQSAADGPLRRVLGVAFCNCLGFASVPKHVFFRNLRDAEAAAAAAGSAPALSIFDSLTPSERGEREGEVCGVGLYPMASLMNHSCRANCVINAAATPDHEIRVVCATHAPPGAALCINYLGLNAAPPPNPRLLCTPQRTRCMRRARLRRRWGFDCRCTACEAEGAAIARATAAALSTAVDKGERESLLKLRNAPPLGPEQERAADGEFDAAAALLEDPSTQAEGVSRLQGLAARMLYQPAEHMLGCVHAFREYGVLDAGKAVRHLRRAAIARHGGEANAPQSWGTLADILSDTGGAEERAAVLCLQRAAAEQGYAGAQAALAELLADRSAGAQGGYCRDDEEAWLWAEAAASQGLVHPQYLLGVWAAAGRGVWQGEANATVAERWLRRAASAGHAGAAEALAALPARPQPDPAALVGCGAVPAGVPRTSVPQG
eukprot:TRINITY_DN24256_c0_g1_i1.p1 TRINITY_DN24256_c0_g1~~TRINITY_DN24256_c0_g1_i1.p1  ORF type:complete len:705 (+),score=135.88 TRINITY_DN24256_c0_g1_i1:63-2117(+)